MESLKEGSSYELLSSTAVNANISVVHVKLTDTALKAIEEFNEWFRKSKGHLNNIHCNIQFRGNQGMMQIPLKGSSNHRQFGFSLSVIDEQKDGNLECIRHSINNGCQSLSTVGIMSHNLRVQATEDVYQATREKMTIAEEESKKARTQTIERKDPNIGRKVKKIAGSKVTAVMPDIIQNIAPPIRPRTTEAAAKQRVVPLSEPRPGSVTSVAEKLSAKTRKSDVGQNGNSLSLRDRVIHLLAIRTYKQPELILRLQRDGCRPDVTSLRSILDDVAQCNRDVFSLHRHLCATEVRSDWPLYKDEEKAVLSRKLKRLDELPVRHSPALSPCPSVGSRGSPHRQSSQKRVSSTTDEGSTMPNSKRPRVSHALNTSSGQAKLTEATTGRRSLPNNSLTNGANIKSEQDSQNGVADDFISVYKPISSDAERRQYKRDFGKEYAEYLDLHKKTEQRMLIFSELSGALKQCLNGSSEYESVKQKIYDEYLKLKDDSQYSDERRRCDYLHRKLGHIKGLVNEFDNVKRHELS